MTIQAPERVWWKPISAEEKPYLAAAFLFAVATFFLMPIWHLIGNQNPQMQTFRVVPQEYAEKVEAFAAKYKVADEVGIPVVAPPAPVFGRRAARVLRAAHQHELHGLSRLRVYPDRHPQLARRVPYRLQ